MTIQFITDAVYTLGSLKLICTYIEDNAIWLKGDSYPASDTILLYKLDRKTKKLYVFNTKVQAWDKVEGSLSEEGVMAKYKPEDVTVIYDAIVNNYLEWGMLWSCDPKDIKPWTNQDKERLDNTLDKIFSIESANKMVYQWSEMYCGLTHYGDTQAFRRATVNHVCNDVYILSKWYKGCGFSPEEVRFDNLEAAKKAGEDWTEKAL